MSRSIVWTDRATRELEAANLPDHKRIVRAVERLAANPGGADIRKLAGEERLWRLRVGDWRVIFEFEASTVIVRNVLPRASAYR